MFFAIELQTSGVYLLSQGQGLINPSKILIRHRKIALHDEYVAFCVAIRIAARCGPVGRRRRRML